MTEFGLDQRKGDFYETNRGNAVNLFSRGGLTQSGDIVGYDKIAGIVILGSCIQRIYSSDGTSEFMEGPYPFGVNTSAIDFRVRTTREDRLGRMVKYNQDLEKENGEVDEKPKKKKRTKSKN